MGNSSSSHSTLLDARPNRVATNANRNTVDDSAEPGEHRATTGPVVLPEEGKIQRIKMINNENHIAQGVDALLSDVASPVVNPAGEDAFQPQAKTNAPAKVGRNEPCPCRSGKKYKKCCGRGQAAKQSMADEFQSDRREADAKDRSAILREVELEAQLLEGTPFGGFQARKLIDYWVTADTWEGLVTEVEGQTYRAPLTLFSPLRTPTPHNDRKAVRFNPTAYYMEWRGVLRPLFLQILGTANQKDRSLNVLEARLLMPIDLNRETIMERQLCGA
jgi:hypothetical protein